ncbi:MAG: C69 family dipeptidase [Firmicutes bacterium]|jgi:dipeptidase|nr:C69 family dipeptidase [Bacillota bacterium]
MRLRSRYSLVLVTLVAILVAAAPALACTSIPVSKGASADGSVMTAHTCDGWYDARTWVVPGKQHEPGEMMPVYCNLLHADRTTPEKIGEIPQAPVTYTYFHVAYPYMNEHQVIMGETTIGNRPELNTTEGIMYIETLQIIGLQRAKTAREAIQIMGQMAEEYGYIDRGECLTVGDPNEIWHFEIMPPGAFEKGAIWAAVRIPEGHVGVSANRSRIGKIDPNDPENYMFSANVFSAAEEMGWWDPKSGEPFLFYDAYNPKDSMGSRRREWRVLSWAAPSLNLDPNGSRFPFTVKAERPITIQDMFKIYRDTMEGTPFDKANVPDWYAPDSKGNWAKSPFATPHANADMRALMNIPAERNISIPGCSYHTVLQARSWLPNQVGGLCWFGLNNPDTSVYIPIYAGVSSLPKNYAVNDRSVFSLSNYKESAWWAFDFIDNLVNRRYQDMIKDLRAVRDPFEAEQFALQPAIEKVVADLLKVNPELAVKFLTDYTHTRASMAVDLFWSLAEKLTVKYDDRTF